MTAVFQFLATNWSAFTTLIGFIALFFMIKQLSHKMELGFKKVENEFTLVRAEMREGFLKIKYQVKRHDHEIRRIKRKLRRANN
jgi:hypothetical protein